METINEFLENPSRHLVLTNPRGPEGLRGQVSIEIGKLSFLEPQVWIATSGSSAINNRDVKMVALSRAALWTSAQAVNRHLKVSPNDSWLNVLPLFHVGGLGTLVRAREAGIKVLDLSGSPWNPQSFVSAIEREKISLTSLVPTQVFDLVSQNIKAPTNLRAVVVGGSALSPHLYKQARNLGYPLLPSFGMTECCSQVATADLASLSEAETPRLKILDHIKPTINALGRLNIKSESLMTGFAQISPDGLKWIALDASAGYDSEDFVEISEGYLLPLGRGQDQIKIFGENVNIAFLRLKLDEVKASYPSVGEIALIDLPDERAGSRLCLVYQADEEGVVSTLEREFNKVVLPFEKITARAQVDQIPKSEMGKVLFSRLRSQVTARN